MFSNRTVLGRPYVGKSYRISYVACLLAGFALVSPAFTHAVAPDEIATSQDIVEESGDIAGASGVGTSSLLVTSTSCSTANPSCSVVDAVLRYNGSTGAYIGVHIPSVQDPWDLAIHPIRESLLVLSRSDATVREYDAHTGAFVRVLVSPGAEGLHLPQGIALTSTGRLFVNSNQAAGQLTKFNGILEFDSNTGAFISNFVDGGSSVSETCSNPICLRGPGAMIITPNSRLYAVSVINDSVQEYNLSGAFQGAFTSAKLIGPSGLVRRPSGTNAGNILVASRYVNPDSPFDDTIVEFNGVSRSLVSTNGGVLSSGLIRPGPLAWHTDGHLLVGERTDDIPPSFPFNADRVSKRNGASGGSLGQFTPSGDTHTHGITALLHTHVNFATDDADADGDTDLKDLASFQNCFPFSTTTQCLTPFDDNRNGTIGRWDFLAFIGNFHGPRRPCTSAGQCNDNDVCSVDQCIGGFCSYSAAADGTSCADNLFCNGVETCRAGVCRGTSPCIDQAHCNEATDTCRQCLVSAECNDNNPCTTDTCTASFTCQYTAHTNPCDDGNPCTTNDRCSAGACVGGPPPNCNDNNVCSTDSCDPVLGCIHTDNLLPCDDGNACTLQDFCLQGTCRPGRDRECDDDNSCTNDSCNPFSGCVFTNRTGSCDDGNPCTLSDVCSNGTCTGTPMNCSDSVQCTIDQCVDGVCLNVPDNSRCSNGDWCDGTETCDATLGCLPGTPPCDDNIPCTIDNCNPDFQTCSHTANHAACSNGLFCDGVEQCHLVNGCEPGEAPDCDDGVECTVDSCDEQAQDCIHEPDDLVCEDNNVCTDDICTETGCEYEFNTDACDDGFACTINDTCANGACAGTAVVCPEGEQCDPADGQCKACLNNGHCNDNNGCTDDTCNAGACVYTPNSLLCDDGLFCTLTDVCSGGICTGSGDPCPEQLCNDVTNACVQCLAASDCQDDNVCTDNICNNGACEFLPNTASCSDGLHCNGAEVCGSGSCQAGTPPNCSDGIPCTTDTCNETTDSCDHTPVNSACDDGLFCTGVETCHATLGCVAGTPPVCDDGVPCTVDTCDVGTDACLFTPDDDFCDDDQFCNGVETCSATLGCQPGTPVDCSSLDTQCTDGVCNEATDACEALPVIGACDDGLFCTSNDLCSNGTCIGQANCPDQLCDENADQCVDCITSDDCPDDLNPCTNPATCVSGTCQVTNNTNSCDDGFFCTINDQCVDGTCVGGEAPCTTTPNLFCDEDADACVECLVNTDCNDDNGCTDDTCVDGVCFQFNNGNPCDDGNYCTVNDQCLGGLCVGTGERCTTAPNIYCNESNDSCVQCLTEAECADDANPCTDLECVDGVCQFTNNTASCDDNQFCTANDVCSNGTCVGSGDPCPGELCNEDTDTCVECLDSTNCNDQNFCTTDACISGTCQFTNNTEVCDDGRFCTVNDICSGGTCDGDDRCPEQCDEENDQCVECLTVNDCVDDANPCTDLACVSGACQFTNNTAACDDGDICTTNDSCSGGVCGGSNACPGQICNPSNGNCVNCLIADDCTDDSDVCTDKACIDGSCQQINNSASCDDGDPCTEGDVCDSGTCAGAPIECDDGNVCNGLETCVGGSCQAGTPLVCDDDNVCTQDSCHPVSGCVYTILTGACDDGLYCTFSESCQNGICTGGTVRTCDHLDSPCTIGVCDEDNNECISQSLPNGDPCDDGLMCTINDQCLGGACGGEPLDCDDTVACTIDTCEEPAGCIHTPNDAACDDQEFCTGIETCTPESGCISSGDPCGLGEFCDEVANACVECLDNSDCNDNNFCTTDSCVLGACQNVNNTLVCDDDLYCTVNDICTDGACVGQERCPDETCTEEPPECTP